MGKKKKGSSRARKPKVQHFTPQQSEARDEGPRLVPLGQIKPAQPFQNYVDLADIALRGNKKL